MADVHEVSVAPRLGFGEVFDVHFDAVHAYLRRRAGDAAEDLAAETFTRAFAAYPRFEPARGALRPWLLGIATNVVHGHRRAEARRLRAYSREAGMTPPPPGGVEVASQLDAARQARAAAAAIARLAPGDRDVLLLVAWADLGYEEVAQALGVPVGTVRSRLNRARTAVRAHLDQEERR